MPEPHGPASHGELSGDVRRPVVRHDLPALDPLPVELGHSTAQEADCGGLLFVRQHFYVGESGGIVDGHVDPVVADAGRAALLPVAGHAVPDLAKASQLLDVDVNQVARSVTARKDDAPAAVQAAIVTVAGLGSCSVGGGLIQTTSG